MSLNYRKFNSVKVLAVDDGGDVIGSVKAAEDPFNNYKLTAVVDNVVEEERTMVRDDNIYATFVAMVDEHLVALTTDAKSELLSDLDALVGKSTPPM